MCALPAYPGHVLFMLVGLSRSHARISADTPPSSPCPPFPPPRWVEDADLWRWALPDSKAFHAGLSAFKLDYHAGRNPQIWEQLQQLDVQQVLDKVGVGSGAFVF